MDRQEFRNLCRQHARGLLAYFVTRGVDFHKTQDLVQETFTVFWERRHRVAEGKAEAFLFGIARNFLRTHWRTDGHSTQTIRITDEHGEEIPDPGNAADMLLHEKERAEVVRNAMNLLSPQQRRVLQLTYFEGFSCAEAARKMGVHRQTAHKWMKRAAHQLRKSLKETVE